MTTLLKTYPSEVVARAAAKALQAAGVPGRDIRLLSGCRVHDVRHEPAGGFAGVVGPDAPVGTYGGTPCLRWQGAGSFAGNPDRQRRGSFADAERDVIATYERGAERSRVAGDPAIRPVLRDAALAGEAPDRVIDELHTGRAVVLAEIADIAASDARARLEEAAHAA